MTVIAHEFALQGRGKVKRDCGYILLSALAKSFPFLHGRREIQIAPPLHTKVVSGGTELLLDGSRLHIRGLSGKERESMAVGWLELPNGSVLGWRGSTPVALAPAPHLYSRLVVYRKITERDAFRAEVFRRLNAMGADPGFTVEVGNSRGLQVKDVYLKGYALRLGGLDEQTSQRLVNEGFGSGTSMGAGVLMPMEKGA